MRVNYAYEMLHIYLYIYVLCGCKHIIDKCSISMFYFCSFRKFVGENEVSFLLFLFSFFIIENHLQRYHFEALFVW